MLRKPAPGLIAVFLMCGCATPDRLVYGSEANQADIFLARDGAPARRLTSHRDPERFPRCSPDGRGALFVRGDGVSREIVHLDLRTGVERQLTQDNFSDSSPAWSPDGQTMFWTRREGRFDRIARMPIAGGRIDYVTDGLSHETMPAVSPSGRLLVRHSYRYGRQTELVLTDLHTGKERRITETGANEYEASWAGEGEILFSSNRDGGHFRLYVMRIADFSVRALADVGEDAWGARMSRDGKVYFYSGKPGSWRSWTVDLAGKNVSPILRDGQSNYGGDWCRD